MFARAGQTCYMPYRFLFSPVVFPFLPLGSPRFLPATFLRYLREKYTFDETKRVSVERLGVRELCFFLNSYHLILNFFVTLQLKRRKKIHPTLLKRRELKTLEARL